MNKLSVSIDLNDALPEEDDIKAMIKEVILSEIRSEVRRNLVLMRNEIAQKISIQKDVIVSRATEAITKALGEVYE